MWGLTVRTAPQLAVVILIAAAVQRILSPIVEFLLAGPAEEGDMLIVSLQWVANPANFALVGIVALAVVWLAGSLFEGSPGGQY